MGFPIHWMRNMVWISNKIIDFRGDYKWRLRGLCWSTCLAEKARVGVPLGFIKLSIQTQSARTFQHSNCSPWSLSLESTGFLQPLPCPFQRDVTWHCATRKLVWSLIPLPEAQHKRLLHSANEIAQVSYSTWHHTSAVTLSISYFH